MATQQQNEGGKEQKVSGGDLGSPVSNDAYNIIAALHEKLEGLEAMRKYGKDGDVQIWKQISDLDRQAVQLLADQLEQLVKDGKFRAAIAGQREGQKPTARS
ncbi:MAG: hypothetical protein JWN44_4783 [Myxococcales bacterium]|nr:hypothetical protein [Myxococcales bacterium]